MTRRYFMKAVAGLLGAAALPVKAVAVPTPKPQTPRDVRAEVYIIATYLLQRSQYGRYCELEAMRRRNPALHALVKEELHIRAKMLRYASYYGAGPDAIDLTQWSDL